MADTKIEYMGKVTNVKAGEKAVLRCEYMSMGGEVIVEACENVGVEPTETITITENTKEGEPLDVTMAKDAIVAVPPPKDYMPIPTKTLPINTLGEQDVTNYAKVDVKVPDDYVLPAGTVTIKENTKEGERLTISPFKYLKVNVPPPDDYMPIPSEDEVKNIENNEDGIDVLHYSKVNVSVPIPEGYVKPSDIPLEIKENTAEGETVDVTYRKNVVVNVPIPEGYVLPEGKYTAERNTAEGELIAIENYKYLEVKVPEIEAPAAPNLIPLNFIPSTQVQEEKPSGEVDGFSSVKVEAIPIATMDKPIDKNGPVDAPEGKYFTHLDVEVPIPEGYFKPEGIYHADRNTGKEMIPIGEYKYLTVGVFNEPFLTSKTVTPTKTGQIVMPGYYNELLGVKYDGLSQVTVNPVPTESLKGDNAIKENGSYTPSEGKFFDEVEVNVQPNLQPLLTVEATHLREQRIGPVDRDGFLEVLVKKIDLDDRNSTTIASNGPLVAADGKYFKSLDIQVPVPDEYIIPKGTLNIKTPGTHSVKEFANVHVSGLLVSYDSLVFFYLNGKKSVGCYQETWRGLSAMGLFETYQNNIKIPSETGIYKYCTGVLIEDGECYSLLVESSYFDTPKYLRFPVRPTDELETDGEYQTFTFPTNWQYGSAEDPANGSFVLIPRNENYNDSFEQDDMNCMNLFVYGQTWSDAAFYIDNNTNNKKVYTQTYSGSSSIPIVSDPISEFESHWLFVTDSEDHLILKSRKGPFDRYYAYGDNGEIYKYSDFASDIKKLVKVS